MRIIPSQGLGCRPPMVLLGLLFLAACQTTAPRSDQVVSADQIQMLARPEPVTVQGIYIHSASSVALHPGTETFRRTEVIKNDARGFDVSVSYAGRTAVGPAMATIHLYPAPWALGVSRPKLGDAELANRCAREFDRAKGVLKTSNPSARLVKEEDTVRPGEDDAIAMRRADYALAAEFEGRNQPLGSMVLIGCPEWVGWVMTYRLTAPEGIDLEQVYEAASNEVGPWMR